MEDIKNDPQGAKFVPGLERYPEATAHVIGFLNDPEIVGRLEFAQELGHPALTGAVRFLEADPAIVEALEDSPRFHQAVGVLVRLKMEERGWSKTGRKGVVTGSRYFSRSEHYTR
jgi:hypothetical protein